MSQRTNRVRIRIDKLSYGGAGIGTSDGKIVFVKRGLPGDLVDAELIKDKKNYCLAEVNRIIEPSDRRVDHECPYFGKCGGCQWQDLDYKSQLIEKQNIVRETLERIGKISNPPVDPVEPSPLKYGYRSKLVLSVVKTANGYSPSFFEEGSDNKVPISECPVANQQVNNGIELVSNFLKSNWKKARSIDKIYIASGDENTGITVTRRFNRKRIKQNLDTDRLKLTSGDETEIWNSFYKDKILYSVPSVFMQANIGINNKITETLIGWVQNSQKVLDLYCGFGNFTIPLSDHVTHITGVDTDITAVNYAVKNSELNKSENCDFTVGDAARFIAKNGNDFDAILLDPPREGARKCVTAITKTRPEKIVYISCNPATLARDVGELCASGYVIKNIKPFDMFPHTFHIECMVLLELKQ